MRAQPLNGERIAHAIVDAEVDVAGIDTIQLVTVREAHGRADSHLVREGHRATVALIDEYSGCRPTVGEGAESDLVSRTEHRGLAEIRARRPGRLQVLGRVGALDIDAGVVEEPAASELIG